MGRRHPYHPTSFPRGAGLRTTIPYLMVVMLSLGLMGTGCDSGTPVAPPPPSQKKSNNTPPPQAQLDERPLDEEEYQRPEYPGRRRNPFEPNVELLAPVQATVSEDVRPVEPLERFPLSSLQLAAIISETAVPRAMFVDPDGFGHVIKEGDRIGRNGGVVSHIRDNEVEVRERREDDSSSGNVYTIKLRDMELATEEETSLSSEEREALERLLATQEGRQALQRATQQVDDSSAPPQASPTGNADNRFPGLTPPRK